MAESLLPTSFFFFISLLPVFLLLNCVQHGFHRAFNAPCECNFHKEVLFEEKVLVLWLHKFSTKTEPREKVLLLLKWQKSKQTQGKHTQHMSCYKEKYYVKENFIWLDIVMKIFVQWAECELIEWLILVFSFILF